MSRTPNTHGGGARTNKNGLHFEQTTSLDNALCNAGYKVTNYEVCSPVIVPVSMPIW